MPDAKQVNNEFKEALKDIKTDIRLTRIMLPCFALLIIFSRFFLKIPIPLSVVLILLFWFFLYLFYPYLVRRKKTDSELYSLHFKYVCLDILFITLIIHYLGGVEWIGVIFYILSLGLAGTILPKKKTILLTFVTISFYSCLVLFEYFAIIPHRPLFALRPGLYQESSYVFPQLLAVAAFFYFVGQTSGTFSEELREKQNQLIKERERAVSALKQAKTARDALELRVKERTKELELLTMKQEDTIKERTKELEKRLSDLERFQKLTVGRELKMMELKKELLKVKKLRK